MEPLPLPQEIAISPNMLSAAQLCKVPPPKAPQFWAVVVAGQYEQALSGEHSLKAAQVEPCPKPDVTP
jgi:hypothetical protein